MKPFADFLSESRQQGYTNILFEAGMYSLGEDLERLLRVFEEANIPFEIVGGLGVLIHILSLRERRRSFLTKDIDVLMSRIDLPGLIRAAETAGYRAQRIFGGHALIMPGQDLQEAVHIIFCGEKPLSAYDVVSPEVAPEIKQIFGLRIPVAPVRDLLILKLNALRPQDEVHVNYLDEAGLITSDVERGLPEVLRPKLESVRARRRANPSI